MKKTLILLLFCLITNVLWSQTQETKVWALQDCIDYALKNNLQIKQTKLNEDLARYQLEQSAAGMLPSLNGSATQNYSAGRNIDPYTNQFIDTKIKSNNFSLSSSMPLFEGFQIQSTLQQSRYSYMAGKYDVQKNKNDITLSVINAYVQILFNKELLKVSQEQLEVSKNQLTRTQKMFDVGSVPKGSLLDAESQAATEELNVINAQNQLDLSYLNLVQLLDIPTTKGFEIVDPQLNVNNIGGLDINTTEVFNYAVQNQPDVKSADLKVKSSQYGLYAARGAQSPRLLLSASLSTLYSDQAKTNQLQTLQGPFTIGYVQGSLTPVYSIQQQETVIGSSNPTSFRDQLDNNFNKFIGFTLQVPILNGLQTRTAINRAKANLASAEYTAQQTKLQLNKTIQQSYADASAAFKKYNATTKALESQTESFKYTQEKFTVGLVSSVDYLTSKNNLDRSQANLLQAKYDYVLKMKILDFYMGKALTF